MPWESHPVHGWEDVNNLGVGHSKGRPVETAPPVGTSPVPAKRIVGAMSTTPNSALAQTEGGGVHACRWAMTVDRS